MTHTPEAGALRNLTIPQTLEEKLPAGNPPSESNEPEYSRWREELQRALVETFCDLSEDFACKGKLAGTTVTVVLQVQYTRLKAECLYAENGCKRSATSATLRFFPIQIVTFNRRRITVSAA